ncbi:MAG TPA: zf-HC2 domain-containing protein [Blastocatellia bacterium]|nr:zf-HC2 domain-containing protein [Blastocatellia bacterium]
MNCSKFEEELSDYLDGQLTQGETGAFAAHALQCRSCRSLMDEIKAALRECKEPDLMDAPASLEASLVLIPFERAPLECSGFEEIITEFLDGFVPASRYHRFEEHAEGCSDCSRLLTDVVYAVAACHSIHTYENYEVSDSFVKSLIEIAPCSRPSRRRAFIARAVALAGHILPRTMHTAPWSFATASTLTFASLALLLFGFSDDGTVGGIYRQAHLKVAELYSHGTELYDQKDHLVAGIERVGLDLGEVWDTLGGDQPSRGEPEKAPPTDP